MTLPAATPELPACVREARILIVDDSETNCLFLEKVLRTRGFLNIRSASSGEEALENYDIFAPDLVILDVIMPGMDGFACARAIRQRGVGGDVPILVQTVLSEPHLRFKAFEEGASDFISKPVYPDELTARIRVHLERSAYLKDLERYKERVDEELESARNLQLSILPSAREMKEALANQRVDIAFFYSPSSSVGGDFWGMKPLSERQIALWIVDFSGHGVAAALNAFRLHAYIREHSQKAASPGKYLTLLNEKLLHLLQPGQFATMFYAVVDSASGTLRYAGAGSPHPLLIRARTHRGETIDASGLPLGIAAHRYATKTLPFHAQDTLMLYSDALIESPRVKDASCFTEDQLLALMATHEGQSAQQQLKRIVSAFQRATSSSVQDDLTLCLCRNSAGV